ncbi:hypothetical protein V495_02527 [Pseudogymnoascus sp. VKM F-4514 (FW-929)]|nr:hypothetical protein V495_02527 [Pseudogymnoascus sp. VKM F-4514 (FW-929)]KFY60364.1 hypothetical protein V497_03696 [Pseudogymnoascus sp. VKM F-4516 (FW-969)]
MTIPANETILAKDDWGDGNLFDQMNREYYAAYPGNEADQGLYLNVYDDNFAAITFKVGSSIMNSAFELSETIFDPNRTQMHVSCVYPVSGQYNTLSRALFYVLIVFSLVFRRHVWISVAALGTAMTYAAVSAVHLFALVGSFRFRDPGFVSTESNKDYVDLDIFGIFPILTAAGIMLTPILMWSNTVRRHHAQPVIVCWGALVFVALATCIGVLMRGLGIINGGTMSINELPSFASCIKTPECMNLQEGLLYRDFYKKCECFDFCGTLSPTAAMRSGENMVPFLITGANKAADNDKFWKLFIVNLFALAFITINGAIGVLESYYSQSEVRNAIFRVCNADLRLWIKVLFEGERQDSFLRQSNRESVRIHKTKRKRVRFLFAKTMATMFYLLAILLSVLCPVVFITSVISSEILIQNYPPSEHSDAVGAWGAWVGAALVILAAVIDRYSTAWLNSILVVLRAMWRVFKYDKKDRLPAIDEKDDELSVSKRIKDFFKEVASPFIHGWYSTRRAWWTSKTNMRLFAAWWKNPVLLSQMRGAELREQWDAEELSEEHGKPCCICRMCKRDLDKKLHGEDNTLEANRNTVLDRARTLARKRRGAYDRVVEQREAYEILNNGPGGPVPGAEMSKLQQARDDSTQASTLAHRMGESEESLYDRPTTPPLMSGSRTSVAYDPSSPPAIPQSAMQRPGFQRAESGPYSPPAVISPALVSPHQGSLPEAALDRRSGYARRDTDQSFGSFAGRRDSDQGAETFARRDTEQSAGLLSRRDTDQSTGPVARRDTDQSMGPITRRDTDQSIGPITRRDTDMSMASRPRRKPVPSYIAPEGEEGMSWQRTMSPDQTSPRRDQAGSGS